MCAVIKETMKSFKQVFFQIFKTSHRSEFYKLWNVFSSLVLIGIIYHLQEFSEAQHVTQCIMDSLRIFLIIFFSNVSFHYLLKNQCTLTQM